jgi:uncharacterized membrane protein HdeD (DUF308 family)
LTGKFLPETVKLFAGRWWALFLRGLAAVAFGLFEFAWPYVTIASLLCSLGFYALVYGIFSLVAAIGRRPIRGPWVLALEDIVGVGAGSATLRPTAITAMSLVFFVSIWAIATGVLRITEAIHLRREMSGDVWLALSGVVAVLFA